MARGWVRSDALAQTHAVRDAPAERLQGRANAMHRSASGASGIRDRSSMHETRAPAVIETMAPEERGNSGDSDRPGEPGSVSHLLWIALFLGYVAGIGAAIAFLPGPIVQPLLLPIAVGGGVLGVAIGGWVIVGRWRRSALAPPTLDRPAEGAARAPSGPAARSTRTVALEPKLRPVAPSQATPRKPAQPPPIGADELRHRLYEGALDPFIRPIHTFEARPVEMFHAVPRLREADGTLLPPARYQPTAARAGLRPLLDQVFVVQAAYLVRHALAEGRDVVLICDVAPSSVAAPSFLEDLGEFLTEHHELASRLVLEFDRTRLERPAEAALAELRKTGLRQGLKRFSPALHDDPSVLAERGFAFVKLELAEPRIRSAIAGDDAELFALWQRLGEVGIELVLERFDDGRELIPLPADEAKPMDPHR